MRPVDEAVGTSPGPDAAHSRRWALWHHQFDLVRAEDQVLYLRRWWLVKTPWGGLILHRMTAPDARPHLHDHPFSFVSFVVRGRGYIERRLNGKTMDVDERHWIRRVNVVRRHDCHAIVELASPVVWTLLLVGQHRRTWGFWERRKFVVPPLRNRPLPVAPTYHEEWVWTKHDAFDSGHYVP